MNEKPTTNHVGENIDVVDDTKNNAKVLNQSVNVKIHISDNESNDSLDNDNSSLVYKLA